MSKAACKAACKAASAKGHELNSLRGETSLEINVPILLPKLACYYAKNWRGWELPKSNPLL